MDDEKKLKSEVGCIEPNMFHKTFASVFKNAYESSISLPPDVVRHLQICTYCAQQTETRREKAQAERLLSFARSVVEGGFANHANIQKRNDGNLIYFFGSEAGDTTGGYIVVWDDEPKEIRQIEYGDLDRFQRFKFDKDTAHPQ
jgi:hypothetical protein